MYLLTISMKKIQFFLALIIIQFYCRIEYDVYVSDKNTIVKWINNYNTFITN